MFSSGHNLFWAYMGRANVLGYSTQICSHIIKRTLANVSRKMLGHPNYLRRVKHSIPLSFLLYLHQISFANGETRDFTVGSVRSYLSGPASSPSLSIWRRKKEMSKEGLIAAKELKRLQTKLLRLDRFISSHVSRLLKSDLVSVLAEFQRQDQVFLCMKLYDVVRREIWYRPDMFFYRDMLMMLARNRKVDETNKVWGDLKREGVLFDQHTFGDLVRAFLDNELPVEAMRLYQEMRDSPDPPLSLPFRVILKGLVPYPELREKVKEDFLELFPGMIVYDPPEDLCEDSDEEARTESDLE